MPSIPYHGHPFEVVIPCMTLEEANAEKADLHAAVEARAFVRPAGAGGVLDRDQAWRDAIQYRYRKGAAYTDEWMLDRLAAAVRPATIDRDALMDLLIRYDVEHPATLGEAADVRAIYIKRILALVRPVAGKQYPYLNGPHLILGPGCFTGDGDEFPQDVIMWRGAAYSRGVTLTPEQARRAAGWYFRQADDIVPDDADRALVAQLEAAS